MTKKKESWIHIAMFPAIILAGLSPILIAMLAGEAMEQLDPFMEKYL